jgi:hypothetical protein
VERGRHVGDRHALWAWSTGLGPGRRSSSRDPLVHISYAAAEYCRPVDWRTDLVVSSHASAVLILSLLAYRPPVGFFGTFVLARFDRLLVDEETVLGFGYQHERLYELGRGWQLLETRGVLDPQDFAAASERFVAATGAGVLAAYVNDGDCVGVYGRTSEGWTTSFHLPVDEVPCSYRHRPQPVPRTTEGVAADLEQWARAVGLTAVPEHVRTIAAYDYRGYSGWGHELPLELLPALRLPEVGEPSPTVIDLEALPWCAVVGSSGLARQALDRRSYRAGREGPGVGIFGPEREWERAAIALEADIWAARHRRNTDITTLRERTDQLLDACQQDDKAVVYRWRS